MYPNVLVLSKQLNFYNREHLKLKTLCYVRVIGSKREHLKLTCQQITKQDVGYKNTNSLQNIKFTFKTNLPTVYKRILDSIKFAKLSVSS